jgi:predicted esterase
MRDYMIEAGAEVEWYEVKDVGHKYLSEYQEKLMDWLKEQKK